MKREFGVEVRLPSNDEDMSTKKKEKKLKFSCGSELPVGQQLLRRP